MTDFTLTEFLLARIAEDEAAARTASAGPVWTWEGEDLMSDHKGEPYSWGEPRRECIIATEGANPPDAETTGAHIARHDPARVLAECEAKRRIVAEWPDNDGADLASAAHGDHAMLEAGGEKNMHRRILLHLAAVYADHSDCRDEWKS